MRNPPEFHIGNIVVKPVAMAAVEVSIIDPGDPAVAWLERGEAAMLASALMSIAQLGQYDPLAGTDESGQLAKI